AGNQVDVAEEIAHQHGQLPGQLRMVVDAVHHYVLKGNSTPRLGHVVPAGVHQLGQGIAHIDGHDLGSDVVVGGVEGDGQGDGQPLFGQAPDGGHQAHRGDGNVAEADAQALRVVDNPQEADQVVVVLQGLAHAHDHDGADALPRRVQGPLQDRKSTRLNSTHVKISYA